MAIRNIRRQATNPLAAPGTPTSAPIYVDSDDNILKMIPAGSGTTEVQVIDASSTQTLTNKTLTSPTITGATEGDFKVLAASATFTSNSVLTTLTGFSWTVVPGTYQFEVNLVGTQTTNGGLSVALTLTTAVLTSIQAQTYQATATDNTTAVSTQSTTTVSATKYIDNKTAAYTNSKLWGTTVVGTGGTVAVQVAQNTSNSDTTTVLLGSYARFTRVA